MCNAMSGYYTFACCFSSQLPSSVFLSEFSDFVFNCPLWTPEMAKIGSNAMTAYLQYPLNDITFATEEINRDVAYFQKRQIIM